MNINMALKILHPCQADDDAGNVVELKPGDEVEYRAHMIGGGLRVNFAGRNLRHLDARATDIEEVKK